MAADLQDQNGGGKKKRMVIGNGRLVIWPKFKQAKVKHSLLEKRCLQLCH